MCEMRVFGMSTEVESESECECAPAMRMPASDMEEGVGVARSDCGWMDR